MGRGGEGMWDRRIPYIGCDECGVLGEASPENPHGWKFCPSSVCYCPTCAAKRETSKNPDPSA